MKLNLSSCFFILLICQGLIYLGQSASCPEGCADDCWKEAGQYVCNSCLSGYYLQNGYQCVKCTQGSPKSTKCWTCPTGYDAPSSATSTDECYKCPEGCLSCFREAGQWVCNSCSSGYYFQNGYECVKCSEGVPMSTKCWTCPTGYDAPSSATSKDECYKCPEGCTKCFREAGQWVCDSCSADFYRDNYNCLECPEGYQSPAGATKASQCWKCDDGYSAPSSATSADECYKCDDDNCDTCTGANIGQCVSCNDGFKLISGTCKAAGESIKTDNMVSATLRYDMTMTQFDNEGGKNFFIAKTSRVLGVDIEQVTVSDVRKGSVIIDYEVAFAGDNTVAKTMKKTMDAAVSGGQMNLFTSAKILDYGSQVGPRDTGDDEGSSKVGLIVGVVVGVAAVVCVAVALVIWKKKAAMMKAKNMNVNKNNKVIAIDDSAAIPVQQA